MKLFWIIIFVHILLTHTCAQGDADVFNEQVLNELDYFDDFLNKFHTVDKEYERVYVLKLSKHWYTKRGEKEVRWLYLLSAMYYPDIIAYINPNYTMAYKGRHYLINSNDSVPITSCNVLLEDYPTKESIVLKGLKSNQKSVEHGPILTAFPYCFWFQAISGEVTSGMSIGKCDPYMNSDVDDSFFYDNSDIERVEGKTIEEIKHELEEKYKGGKLE